MEVCKLCHKTWCFVLPIVSEPDPKKTYNLCEQAYVPRDSYCQTCTKKMKKHPPSPKALYEGVFNILFNKLNQKNINTDNANVSHKAVVSSTTPPKQKEPSQDDTKLKDSPSLNVKNNSHEDISSNAAAADDPKPSTLNLELTTKNDKTDNVNVVFKEAVDPSTTPSKQNQPSQDDTEVKDSSSSNVENQLHEDVTSKAAATHDLKPSTTLLGTTRLHT